ncbi:MAG: hypothetical protein H5T86_05170 [Armatimonadetes bacterium]|nr:hypothetical protein [Armatimonadota bacterium]
MRAWPFWAVVVLLVVAVLFAARLAVAQQEGEAQTKAAAPSTTLPPDQLVVAAVPYRYETDYELDPFDRTTLRRTKTRVTHILLIHADGSSVIKPAD